MFAQAKGAPNRMPSSHDAEAATALLQEPVFAALAEEAVRDYIDWADLTTRPLPPGLSVLGTWRLLTTVRRFAATPFPIPDPKGRTYWYTLTREGLVCIETIERHCRADSAAHRAILHRHGHRFLVGSRIHETVAVCRLDGVIIATSEAESLLMSGRAPRSPAERLLLNAHALLYELDDVEGEPFSPELLTRLYRRLIDGVDMSGLERQPVRHGLTDRLEGSPVTPTTRAGFTEQFCAYANGKTGDPAEPVVIRAHELLNLASFRKLSPDFNGIIGRCVFRLFVTRQDYPVLADLPISTLYQSWAEGHMQSSVVRFSSKEIARLESYNVSDFTPDVLTYLQITVVALDDLLSSIQRTRRRDAEVRSTLEHDVKLNYRQRSVIAHALADPDAEFRIREHRTAYNVAYATARADLLGLVALGYLHQEQRGKAFVFLPEPDLAKRLGGADKE